MATDVHTCDSSLTQDERMLLLLRDELYEGDWDELVQDLQDRLNGRPHLFDIQPASPRLQETIRLHLQIIQRLRERETQGSAGSADGVSNPVAPPG